MRKWNMINDSQELEAMALTAENNKLTSGWSVWDDWFGGFRKGTLQYICAPTGHGKTTILIAMAKLAVKQGYKVLLIGTEQPAEMLYPTLKGYDIDFVRKEEGTSIYDCIGEDTYDILLYDYLGAESGVSREGQEWQLYRDQANALSELAITKNICVITGGQADSKIFDTKQITDVPNNASLVSYSKHVIAKVSAAVYLLRKDDATWMVMIKNRYGVMETTPKQIYLNYKDKEVLDEPN